MPRYVIFKENPNTHHEQYVQSVVHDELAVTNDVEEALAFPSAADAYRYGAWNRPILDWWRVGQR